MDYEKLRELRNEQNVFGDLAGVRIVEIREGYARTEGVKISVSIGKNLL